MGYVAGQGFPQHRRMDEAKDGARTAGPLDRHAPPQSVAPRPSQNRCARHPHRSCRPVRRLRCGGGQTTKIHALTDVVGQPFALTLTPETIADISVAPELLERAGKAHHVLANKGYDADALRRSVRQADAVPVIPGRSGRKRPIRHDRTPYRDRHLIENAFCRLKDFHRVATRYDKLAANFISTVALATVPEFWI
jgi:transposase